MDEKKVEAKKPISTGLEDLGRPQRMARSRHLSDCYLLNYPNDEGVYCTCLDWSPEI